MHEMGFIKVASAVPTVRVADCAYNAEQIANLLTEACCKGASIVAFPELSITGYTCADLFVQPYFLTKAEQALGQLLTSTAATSAVAVVGMPIKVQNSIYNCAVVIRSGKILGVVPKTHLPNYEEFYEARWFTSGRANALTDIVLCDQIVPFGTNIIFDSSDTKFGVELCEDLWVTTPPSCQMAQAGAEIIVNISASDEMVGKHAYLLSLIKQQSARLMSAYVYSSAGFGESTTDVVFAGNAIVAENGTLLTSGERFCMKSQIVFADVDLLKLRALRLKTSTYESVATSRQVTIEPIVTNADVDRKFEPFPFIPQDERTMSERCSEIFSIQINGFAQRYIASRSKKAVVGISGGLDSTLALLVAVRTMDRLGLPRKDVVGITMPGFGTTGRTYHNAVNLIKALGAELREVSIKDACNQHFKDIDLAPDDRSVTYENSQARERTQILMDIANKENGLVVGTGGLSELALGRPTYTGGLMRMYGVNASVPKTLVRYLVKWVAMDGADASATPYLLDIVDTPISPELLPADEKGLIAQKTEDLVGPYDLHDFFIYNFVRFGFPPRRLHFMALRAFAGTYCSATIKKWLIVFLRRFFAQQFKRSALPDGPKVGSVSLSPRGDWRMPSDASVAMWMAEAEAIEVQ